MLFELHHFRYSPHRRSAKAQTGMGIHTVLSELSLLAHTTYDHPCSRTRAIFARTHNIIGEGTLPDSLHTSLTLQPVMAQSSLETPTNLIRVIDGQTKQTWILNSMYPLGA